MPEGTTQGHEGAYKIVIWILLLQNLLGGSEFCIALGFFSFFRNLIDCTRSNSDTGRQVEIVWWFRTGVNPNILVCGFESLDILPCLPCLILTCKFAPVYFFDSAEEKNTPYGFCSNMLYLFPRQQSNSGIKTFLAVCMVLLLYSDITVLM